MVLRTALLARTLLAFGSVALAAGCSDVRLYPLQAEEPPIPTVCPHGLVGFATLNGGTTGGLGGETVTVDSAAAFAEEAARIEPRVIQVQGILTLPEQTDVASNKTIVGIGSSSGFTGKGLDLSGASNVILHNLIISKTLKADAITLDESRQIWIDHCDLFSDRESADVDVYDGLVDVTHASDFVTISWTRFHDHYKTTLVGHSATNVEEDADHLTVTYHHNAFVDVQTGVRVRFGTVHVFNNYFRNVPEYGVVSQMGAAVLIENNVFDNVGTGDAARYTIDTVYVDPMEGLAREQGNLFIVSDRKRINMTTDWSPTSPTLIYPYTADSPESARALVQACAGVGKMLQ